MSVGRNTSTRDQHRKVIARDKPPCGICGLEIDYTLHYLDPMAYVVDHIIPLDRGGEDVLENKQAAHRKCNREKSNKLAEELVETPRTFVTPRVWWAGEGTPSPRVPASRGIGASSPRDTPPPPRPTRAGRSR